MIVYDISRNPGVENCIEVLQREREIGKQSIPLSPTRIIVVYSTTVVVESLLELYLMFIFIQVDSGFLPSCHITSTSPTQNPSPESQT